VKPEKYKWKIREVRFLEVVIGLEKIKIEQKKVKTVLDWPTLQGVKCYELKSLELDKRTNSCIRGNTRELNRELFYKLVYFI